MTQRYLVRHGRPGAPRFTERQGRITFWPHTSKYVVFDTTEKCVVFQSDSKSEVIAKSQDLNGFEVNGDERTYLAQVTAKQSEW